MFVAIYGVDSIIYKKFVISILNSFDSNTHFVDCITLFDVCKVFVIIIQAPTTVSNYTLYIVIDVNLWHIETMLVGTPGQTNQEVSIISMFIVEYY